MKRFARSLLFLAAALLVLPAWPQSQDHQASGKVVKVDAPRGTVTIAHGPVPSLNWPAMTMAFKAKDKAILDRMKPGEQVQFSFVQSGRDYTLTGVK